MVRHPGSKGSDMAGEQFAACVGTLVLHEGQLRQLLFISLQPADLEIQLNRISRLQLS